MEPKYEALLDDEVKAYIARCDALYPPDAVDLDIAGQRRVYDLMCADFDVGRPDNVSVWDEPHGGVPCRRYEVGASDETVIYYHGGGFVVGSLDSHDSICAELCANTGLRVVAVDYPLAPEHSYPDDFNASLAAFEAVSTAWPGSIVLCGDSAGANLAAALSGHLRGADRRPVGQVLIYGGFGGDRNLPSYTQHANAPQLTVKDMEFYMMVRPGGTPPVGDPRYAPLQDTDFTNLPPTLCVSAACDPLASDSGAYCDVITSAGGQAHWVNEDGLVHGYLRARTMSEKAAKSFERICVGVQTLARGAWDFQ
ncbi:MAG: alpha/beta hydrolase [Aliishimia sp.]